MYVHADQIGQQSPLWPPAHGSPNRLLREARRAAIRAPIPTVRSDLVSCHPFTLMLMGHTWRSAPYLGRVAPDIFRQLTILPVLDHVADGDEKRWLIH